MYAACQVGVDTFWMWHWPLAGLTVPFLFILMDHLDSYKVCHYYRL